MGQGRVWTGRATLAALLMLVGSAAAVTAATPTSAPIVGGWSPAPVRDAGVQAAAREAARQLGRPKGTLRRVLAASQQVVAGLNYRLDIQLRDGTRWRVTLWRRLDGVHELTASERL